MFILDKSTGTQTSTNLGTTQAEQIANGVPNPTAPPYVLSQLTDANKRFRATDGNAYSWDGDPTTDVQSAFDAAILFASGLIDTTPPPPAYSFNLLTNTNRRFSFGGREYSWSGVPDPGITNAYNSALATARAGIDERPNPPPNWNPNALTNTNKRFRATDGNAYSWRGTPYPAITDAFNSAVQRAINDAGLSQYPQHIFNSGDDGTQYFLSGGRIFSGNDFRGNFDDFNRERVSIATSGQRFGFLNFFLSNVGYRELDPATRGILLSTQQAETRFRAELPTLTDVTNDEIERYRAFVNSIRNYAVGFWRDLGPFDFLDSATIGLFLQQLNPVTRFVSVSGGFERSSVATASFSNSARRLARDQWIDEGPALPRAESVSHLTLSVYTSQLNPNLLSSGDATSATVPNYSSLTTDERAVSLAFYNNARQLARSNWNDAGPVQRAESIAHLTIDAFRGLLDPAQIASDDIPLSSSQLLQLTANERTASLGFYASARALASQRWENEGVVRPYKVDFLTDGDFGFATGRTNEYITEFDINTDVVGLTFFDATVSAIKLETLTSDGGVINAYDVDVLTPGVTSDIAFAGIEPASRLRVTMSGHNDEPATCAEIEFGAADQLGISDPTSFILSVEPSNDNGYKIDVDMRIPRNGGQDFRNKVALLGSGSTNLYQLDPQEDSGTSVNGYIQSYTLNYDRDDETMSVVHLVIVGNNE